MKKHMRYVARGFVVYSACVIMLGILIALVMKISGLHSDTLVGRLVQAILFSPLIAFATYLLGRFIREKMYAKYHIDNGSTLQVLKSIVVGLTVIAIYIALFITFMVYIDTGSGNIFTTIMRRIIDTSISAGIFFGLWLLGYYFQGRSWEQLKSILKSLSTGFIVLSISITVFAVAKEILSNDVAIILIVFVIPFLLWYVGHGVRADWVAWRSKNNTKIRNIIQQKQPDLLQNDEPISTIEDDRLSRGILVNEISRQIMSRSRGESLVIALNGQWGTGKSSFLNLLKNRLKNDSVTIMQSAGNPIIIHFNPWLYGNIEQLVQMFFAKLAQEIGADIQSKLEKKLGELLYTLGSIITVFSTGAGYISIEEGNNLVDEKSMSKIKSKIEEILPQINQNVVVFIDDLDRLESDAIKVIFRMVRLIADFPNVTYVLAFDRLVVENSLAKSNGIVGREYLEKIIQVSFDIPEPEEQKIVAIFKLELQALRNHLKLREFDDYRWGNIFYSGIDKHFRTLRHVKRYMNGLRLTLPSIAKEVNLVDFLVIELVRVFHPQIYIGIARGKDKLTTYHNKLNSEELQNWAENLLSTSTIELVEPLRKILRKLFPRLNDAYNEHNTVYDFEVYSKWRKEKRVCSSDIFDKFFLLGIPTGELPEVDMVTFLSSLSDIEQSVTALREANRLYKSRWLIERLEDYINQMSNEHIKNLLKTLLICGDELRFSSNNNLNLITEHFFPAVVYKCLHKLNTNQERCDLLKICIQRHSALYTAINLVSELESVTMNDNQFLRYNDWKSLRDLAISRIRTANEDGTLWKLDRIDVVIYRWNEWTTGTEAKDAVTNYIQDDSKFVDFLGRLIAEENIHEVGDMVPNVISSIDKQNLGNLLDLDSVTKRITEIASSGEDYAEQACELFELFNE